MEQMKIFSHDFSSQLDVDTIWQINLVVHTEPITSACYYKDFNNIGNPENNNFNLGIRAKTGIQ